MLSQENKNEIISKMNAKKIKKAHQKYILKYIELNSELFSFLNIEELTQRILENFGGVGLNLSSILYHDYAQYIATTGKILLSPKMFFGKNKKYKDSVFFHELDHCACSPIRLRKSYKEYKNKLKEKYKYFYKIIPDFVATEIFLKIHYEGPISGIGNLARKKGHTKLKLLYGTNLINYLNEGITYLKQKMYSENLKIKFHKQKDYLYGAQIGAECIANVIGIDNLIYYHFNNKYEDIEKVFFEKTNIKLEDLMLKCLRYDRKRSKKRLKELTNLVKICNFL